MTKAPAPEQQRPAERSAEAPQAEPEAEATHGAVALAGAFAAPPDHPTARGRRQALARGFQRTVGNRAAQRLVQRDAALPPVPNYQLTTPSLSMPPRRPSLLGGDQPQLRLDPAIEAELRAMQVRAMLDPALLRPGLSQLPVGPIQLMPPPGPATTPAPQAPPTPAPATTPGQAPAPPRAGTGGDILGAIMAVPEVDQILTRLQSEAGDRVRRDWAGLRLGGQVALVSISALIAGGAIAGVASSPDAQRFVFSQLSGKVVPVPGLSFLRVEFNAQDSNLMLGLHLDVGALLPSFLGFGPGSSSPMGGPPQPAAPPAQRSTVMRSPAAPAIQRDWFDDIVDTVSSAGSAIVDSVGGMIDDVDTKSRGMSAGEISAATELFGETIDYSLVVIERNSLYNAGSSRTIGNTIALTDSKFEGDALDLNADGQSTLIHELAHVWQHQNRGWTYAPEALWAQAEAWWETGDRNNAYDWQTLHEQGTPWEEWNPEAQAEAVQDYNDALQKIRAGDASPEDYQTLVDAEPYVDQMRTPPTAPEEVPPSSGGGGGPSYDTGGGGGADGAGGTISPLRRRTTGYAARRSLAQPEAVPSRRLAQRQALVQRSPETDWERLNSAGQVDWVSDRRMILWNFRVERSQLKPDHITALEQFFRANGVLYRNPAITLDLSGHTSGSGPGTVNASVSDARTRAVSTWAQGEGHLTAAQVSSSAAGASRPLVAEASPLDMAHNRRVELEVRVPPGAPAGGLDMHAGAAIPDAATQAEIFGELGRPVAAPAPAPGPAGPAPAPPAAVAWDGAMVGGVLTPAAVAARATLRAEVTTALQAHLVGEMPNIRAVATQPRLPAASFEGPGQAAKTVVDARFGNFAAAAALTADQATTRHGFQFRASGPDQTLFDAFDPADRAATGSAISAESVSLWMADRGAARTAQATHHFDPNDSSRGPDEAAFLFNEIITPFATANRADLEQYDQFGFALTPDAGRVVMYTALRTDLSNAPGLAGAMSPAERATRWGGWMTLVHEYIHTLEHPAYSTAASGNGVMREGFCELFTKEVLDSALPAAPGNVALRNSVEGPGLPAPTQDILPSTYPPNAGYMDDFLSAVAIRNRIGENAAKAAFFQGHVEFLGLAPDSSAIAPSAGPQITVPAGVASLAALVVATGVPEADIIAANPGVNLAAALPPRVAVPGCSEHLVVEAVDEGGAHQLETQAQIATQHNVVAADLIRANPTVDWAHLSVGQRLLIPRH